jgi:RNA polymerase sigma-70 factor (ECF subfamily)
VFSIVHRMVRDRELAEDLAQEAFVRTFNNLDRYDPSYKFSSWLFKIAYNLTVDHLRRKKVKTISIHGAPDAMTTERQEATSVTLESEEEAPDERLEALELAGELERAIATLREDYRTAILLRHVEGRPYEEIAEIMDIPLGTVKTYIFRARRQLRDELADVYGAHDE